MVVGNYKKRITGWNKRTSKLYYGWKIRSGNFVTFYHELGINVTGRKILHLWIFLHRNRGLLDEKLSAYKLVLPF
jgi:hypothetical protein